MIFRDHAGLLTSTYVHQVFTLTRTALIKALALAEIPLSLGRSSQAAVFGVVDLARPCRLSGPGSASWSLPRRPLRRLNGSGRTSSAAGLHAVRVSRSTGTFSANTGPCERHECEPVGHVCGVALWRRPVHHPRLGVSCPGFAYKSRDLAPGERGFALDRTPTASSSPVGCTDCVLYFPVFTFLPVRILV